MYEKDFALKILEIVNKEKVCLISDESNLITRIKVLKYYYSSEEEKIKHSEKMIKQGYELSEQSKERLYGNLYLGIDSNIYTIVGIYIKYDYYKPFID